MATEPDNPPFGKIFWTDLTVPDAAQVRDFYSQVVGWKPEEVNMGGYSDYTMLIPGVGQPAAGICYARGSNADLPAQWLVYILVPDVEAAAERCRSAGGKVIVGPREMGDGRFCVIQDPAGAVAALYANPK